MGKAKCFLGETNKWKETAKVQPPLFKTVELRHEENKGKVEKGYLKELDDGQHIWVVGGYTFSLGFYQEWRYFEMPYCEPKSICEVCGRAAKSMDNVLAFAGGVQGAKELLLHIAQGIKATDEGEDSVEATVVLSPSDFSILKSLTGLAGGIEK